MSFALPTCHSMFHSLDLYTDKEQESFYAKLKKFADEHNTNLYVSNIPKNMNEHVSSSPPAGPSFKLTRNRHWAPFSPLTKFARARSFVILPARAVASGLLGKWSIIL